MNSHWQKYLHRLGLNSAKKPSLEFLQSLHLASVRKIPFENLDPFLGKMVSLELPDLVAKILENNRGGYCFELNSLFLSALMEFGFDARAALGRVFMGRPQPGPRTHQVTLVNLDGERWLADVGFGGPGLLQAIPFRDGYEEIQRGRRIRLRSSEEWGMLYEEEFKGSWRTVYCIPPERTEAIDLVTGNHYCATHPDSIFRNSLYCAGDTDLGRITIFNRSVATVSGEPLNIPMSNPEDILALFHRMGVVINMDDARKLHERLGVFTGR